MGIEGMKLIGAKYGRGIGQCGACTVSEGAIEQENFHQIKPLRIGGHAGAFDAPGENDHCPVGFGQPATTVVAPAIADAVAGAVGARIRDLSITLEKVRQALEEK